MSPEEQKSAIDRIRHSLQGCRPRTLIIEDEETDAFMVLRSLHSHGIEAEWVKDAQAALTKLRTGEFKIVFLDLKLQSFGGQAEDILRVVRDGIPSCQVIVLTGVYSQDSQSCANALQLGAVAIMLKPLTNEQIELIYGTP